jgi:hypothetical protein
VRVLGEEFQIDVQTSNLVREREEESTTFPCCRCCFLLSASTYVRVGCQPDRCIAQVSAAESLLTLISELKQAVLLYDLETRNAEVTARAQQYRDHEEKTRKVLSLSLPHRPFSSLPHLVCSLLQHVMLFPPPAKMLQTLHRDVQAALLELGDECVHASPQSSLGARGLEC